MQKRRAFIAVISRGLLVSVEVFAFNHKYSFSDSISISAVPTIFAENENLKRYVQQLIESRTQVSK